MAYICVSPYKTKLKAYLMKTLADIDFKDKKALIRVDFNVPLDDDFNVTDANRIEAAKPTIDAILKAGGSVILMSHLGRPKGKEDKYSLKHIVKKTSEILGVEVQFAEDSIGSEVEAAAKALKPGGVLLLENLRFYKEEEAGDKDFAKKLAALGDVYVNDAFGTAHRAHASTTIIADYFPQDKVFGTLLAREIESLDKVLKSSAKPVTRMISRKPRAPCSKAKWWSRKSKKSKATPRSWWPSPPVPISSWPPPSAPSRRPRWCSSASRVRTA